MRAITIILSLALVATTAAAAADGFDRYGGDLAVVGTATGSFHSEVIGTRWWLVTPEGHGMFLRSVSGVDDQTWANEGGFTPFDAVYLVAGGRWSGDLSAQAEDSLPHDVVHPLTGATVADVGDAIVIGQRLRPNRVYCWLDRLGVGGVIRWSYLARDGWKPINGTGDPAWGTTLANGHYSFDTGGYLITGADGLSYQASPNADLIDLWDLGGSFFPADFTPGTIAGDARTLYWIKGEVVQPFTTAPIVTQCYERSGLHEAIMRKYGPGDAFATWADAMTGRLRGWGFNATGQYSNRYVLTASDDTRLPVEPIWQLSSWAMRTDFPYHVKNVYTGAVFPPKGPQVWQGLQADMFDPGYGPALAGLTAEFLPGLPAVSYALIPEEGDALFGIDSLGHPHLGYTVLAQNPYLPADGAGVAYDEPRLYAKYALRDFLRDRYRRAGEALPAFGSSSAVPAYAYAAAPTGDEAAALSALNAAWGTAYTTWDTASGDVLAGTNAWGRGSGFLDEDGSGVVASGATDDAYSTAFTEPSHPAIRADLDDFVALAAERYGALLAGAFAGKAHPALLMPLYGGPTYVYGRLAPYIDGFSVSTTPDQMAAIYDAARKPMIAEDYSVATPDSPLGIHATVAAVSYDSSTDRTRISATDLRWRFRIAQYLYFPDLPDSDFHGGLLGWVYPWPPVRAAGWDWVEIDGDWRAGLTPGMRIESSQWFGPFPLQTQPARAEAMIAAYRGAMAATGADGLGFVIGMEHWDCYDSAPTSWFETLDSGICTFLDNAYDGVEAMRAPTADASGRAVGGEYADYGDLLGTLAPFLRSIDATLRPQATGGTRDTTPPVISAVTVGGITASGATISWTTDEPADGQVEYGLAPSYGAATPLASSLTTSHTRAISGLSPATLCHLRVESRDGAGNLAVGDDIAFTTASGPSGTTTGGTTSGSATTGGSSSGTAAGGSGSTHAGAGHHGCGFGGGFASATAFALLLARRRR